MRIDGIAYDSQVAKIDCHDLTSSSLVKQGEAEVSLVMTVARIYAIMRAEFYSKDSK